MKKYIIKEEEYKEVEKMRKKNKNKWIEKRLKVIKYRYEGLKDAEIAERTGYARKRISQLCAEFQKKGIEEYTRIKYGGNHRNISYEEEKKMLEDFSGKAEKGQVIEISEIKKAYEEKAGKEIKSHGHIYWILKRHGWRKVMPRSKHPKKASEEAIEASKKLKQL